MQVPRAFPLTLALAALGSGCVGSGPNTRQSALGGATAGEVAGGVVGHNRGSGNTLGGAAIGAAAGGLGGALVGHLLDRERGTDYPSFEYATMYAVEQPPLPPPPPRRELVVVRPARQAVWVSGYHAYLGRGRYAWVPGHWEVPPGRSRQFVQPRWERAARGYVYRRGYWR